MKVMVNSETGQTLKITEHMMTRNFWEYYVTDETDGDIARCLVLGFEDEIGDVYLPEIAPYIITKTKKLSGVMPAPGWNWK